MWNKVNGFVCLLALGLILPATAAFGQSGKIAGTITDAATGESLIGVNVVIDGTTQGSVTNADGYYVILNVRPGSYDLRASYIGYTPQLVEGVRVNIDQTTEINFRLREQIVEGEEVVVTAERPVVQRDVSASTANVTAEEIEQLPVSSVSAVVGLQAGIQGLTVRGSGSDQLSFMVNGLTLRDERNNQPFTGISILAIEEVQIVTGGFNAEYGNVRSGLINVVTKEGGRNRYSADVMYRNSPPGQKHFGSPANDPNSYWIRPYIDPEVAFSGTQAWDPITRSQYPNFEGWISVSEALLADDNPANDMTPEALRQAFLWQHRKQVEITEPDYTLDGAIGGPVPFLNRFGDTRFFASARRNQNMYLIPLSEDRYTEESAHVKITTDFAPGRKLSIEGLKGTATGSAISRGGGTGIFQSASSIASEIDRVSFIDTRIFATDYWAPTRVAHSMLGATFTHTLNQRTYYETRLTRFASDYDTNPGRLRDTTKIVSFGGVGFDEGPFGFMPEPSFGVGGMRMGVGMSNARDTSRVVAWNFKGDLTSQVNQYLQIKTGIEYNLTESLINYGTFDAFLRGSNSQSKWEEYPARGAAYGQGKLEFRGMIANVGLRLDYFHAGGEWYEFDPFTRAFSARFAAGLDTLLEATSTERIFNLSPRLGISFPVTGYSKLYFNYGHFRSMPFPESLYLIRQFSESGQVSLVANPNNPLPRTVAYEMGYEHSLFDQYLIRLAGYYKDVSLQPFGVTFRSRDGQTEYITYQPNSYADTRGFELTLSKNRGPWIQGFVNYTYMVDTFGYFGFRIVQENLTEQRRFEEDDTERRRAFTRPVPRPYARMNLVFFTPNDFGPEAGGLRPLAAWQVSFLGSWQEGSRFTWTGGGAIPGIANNVQFKDFTNADLRFQKTIRMAGRRAYLFMDIYNLFNQKRLSLNGFVDGNDYNSYMHSLHLPESDDYPNIPGSDRPGDYRPENVAFQPISSFQNRQGFAATPIPGMIYYEFQTGQYLEFKSGNWQAVDQSRLSQVLDDRAYIDNPSMPFLSFLNPRNVYFGIRISL